MLTTSGARAKRLAYAISLKRCNHYYPVNFCLYCCHITTRLPLTFLLLFHSLSVSFAHKILKH